MAKQIMMSRKIYLPAGFIILVWFHPACAQQRKLTLSESVLGQYRQFKPETFDFVKAIPETDDFSFVENFTSLKRISGADGKIQEIMDLKKLNFLLEGIGANKRNSFPYDLVWESSHSFRFGSENIYRVDLSKEGGKISEIMAPGSQVANLHISYDGKMAVYTRENNLFLLTAGKKELAITSDKNPAIVNGSDYVHRQEFGIHEGIFISPKGNHVAWYRKDETMVTDYPLVNSSQRIAKVTPVKYPMAGMTNEQVTLGIYTPATGKTIFLKTGEPADQYLTAVSWDPSEKYVFVGILNRAQNHLKLNRYSAETGDFINTLFEEKHDKWVEPENPPYFLKNTPDVFIWQSERDGYNNLYLYNTSGKLLMQLTREKNPVLNILGTDAKEQFLYYSTSDDLGMSEKIFRVNLKNGKSNVLTPEKGKHSAVLSANGNYLFTQYSSLNTPNISSLIQTRNGTKRIIKESENPYKDIALPKAEFVTITASDGKTPLNGRLIRPLNFDPSKKYPVIVYVYGGPHAQLVSDSWLGGASLWEYYMAQEGYVMFTLDNRGSANRGFEFENVIHRRLGQEEIKDQMKGVEYLKSLPFVDADRMGVYGWSFGGFMTTTLLTSYPGVFKAGVAGGPVMDWKFYEIMYGERYMDTPEENPEGYALTALPDKCKNLNSRLLIIHGAQDDVVVMQHSLEFINACIKDGKQVDFFVYPDHKHNVIGKDRIHLKEKITDYFNLHLK